MLTKIVQKLFFQTLSRAALAVALLIGVSLFIAGQPQAKAQDKVSPICEWPTALSPNMKECELHDDADGVVDGQVVLTETLSLESDSKLNCKGLKLVPTSTGTPELTTRFCSNNPTMVCTINAQCGTGTCTDFKEYKKSQPELAILIKGAHGVKVQNCTIGDTINPFDFSLLVLNAKTPEESKDDPGAQELFGNKILSNTITTRYGGINIVKSDNTLVADNQVTFGVGAGGIAVQLAYDADRNHIVNNVLQAQSVISATQNPDVPQGPLGNRRHVLDNSNPLPVRNFVFNNELTQVARTTDALTAGDTWLGSCVKSAGQALGTCTRGVNVCNHNLNITCTTGADCGTGNSCGIQCVDDFDCGLSGNNLTSAGYNDENVFDGNTIDIGGTDPSNRMVGIIGSTLKDSKITNNLVKAARDGIHTSGDGNLTLAGTCEHNQSRFCGSAADCFIDGFDDTPGVGPCIGARDLSMNGRSAVMLGSKNLLIANNILVGPFTASGIDVERGTLNATVSGNEVSGGGGGIRIAHNAVESTTVRNNKVDGNRYPLNISYALTAPALVGVRKLVQTARFYGSQISLNDFLGGEQMARIAIGTCSNEFFLGCNNNTDCPTGGTCLIDVTPDNVELSELDRGGNYWARDCADSDGFRDVDEPDADGKTDSPLSVITDSHPYGESVAETLPPASCIPGSAE